MLVTFLRLLFIGCALVFIFMLIHAWWHKRRRGELESTPFWPVAAIGFVANFLDTLGVGSFAVKTACYKQFKLIDDRLLPGTLNSDARDPACGAQIHFDNARSGSLRYAMNNSFGFGGNNCSLVFGTA